MQDEQFTPQFGLDRIDGDSFNNWKKLGDKTGLFQGLVEANLIIN